MCSIFAVFGVWAQRKTAQNGPTSALSEIGLLLIQEWKMHKTNVYSTILRVCWPEKSILCFWIVAPIHGHL